MKKFNELCVKCICTKESIKNKVRNFIKDNSGQGALDTAVIVLISIVLGALILAGLYALIDDTVLPTLTKKIKDMFNYAG